MQKFLSSLVFAGLLVSCGKVTGSVPANTPPDQARDQAIDNTTWMVTEKYCDAVALPVTRAERVQFNEGVMAHVQLLQETPEELCWEATAFLRQIVACTGDREAYQEIANLQSEKVREVCRRKSDQSVVRDENRDAIRAASVIEFHSQKKTARLEWQRTPECPEGKLKLLLQKL